MPRALPPDDITPAEFFVRWAPEAVRTDADRRKRLTGLDVVIQFHLEDAPPPAAYFLKIADGQVDGFEGIAPGDPDLSLWLDLDTWRALNRGDLKAPHAVMKRKLRFKGRLDLALKLHFIIG